MKLPIFSYFIIFGLFQLLEFIKAHVQRYRMATFEQSRNPFLNHLVIENILKYVQNISDLKNLRQLCHQWKELTTLKLIQNSIVNINSPRKMGRYLDSKLSVHKNFHLKILQSLDCSQSETFLKSILSSALAQELHLSKCVMNLSDMLMILKFGNRGLTTLSFNEILVDKEDPNTFGQKVMDVTKSLRRLEVTTCEDGEEFPWTEIFSRTPSLETLHAQLQSLDQVNALLESLLELNPEQRPKLQEFSSFLIDFELPQLTLLSCLEFPLRILDLSISSSVTTQSIVDLLKSPSIANNLENLKLFHETEKELNKILLPSLKSLRSLEIFGDSMESNIFPNVHRSCPKLRQLNLSQIMLPENVLKMNFINESLVSLSIEEGFLPFEVLLKLGGLFSSIKRICLFLNDKNIGALFKGYPSLEEIIVLGTELTDLGIIGVSPKGSGRISDCKRLRKFSLYPQPQHRITDMSIYHGLTHVSELTFVELPETCITNEGLRSLIKAKPNLVKLLAKIAINPRTGEHSLRSTKYQIL